MLDKREELLTNFALLLGLIWCTQHDRDCLTYDMTNYFKAMKNLLNEIIGDILCVSSKRLINFRAFKKLLVKHFIHFIQ